MFRHHDIQQLRFLFTFNIDRKKAIAEIKRQNEHGHVYGLNLLLDPKLDDYAYPMSPIEGFNVSFFINVGSILIAINKNLFFCIALSAGFNNVAEVPNTTRLHRQIQVPTETNATVNENILMKPICRRNTESQEGTFEKRVQSLRGEIWPKLHCRGDLCLAVGCGCSIDIGRIEQFCTKHFFS